MEPSNFNKFDPGKFSKSTSEKSTEPAPVFIAPSAFLAQHKIGHRGWVYIQGVIVECELVGYMIEVTGENHKSSKPSYRVKFYIVQDGALIKQETVVKESSFKNTIDEVLKDIEKSAVTYPKGLSSSLTEA